MYLFLHLAYVAATVLQVLDANAVNRNVSSSLIRLAALVAILVMSPAAAARCRH